VDYTTCPVCKGLGFLLARCPGCGKTRVRSLPAPCCGNHTGACEPPSELCCAQCPELTHPRHDPDQTCVQKVWGPC
jgi:hypothetical protein